MTCDRHEIIEATMLQINENLSQLNERQAKFEVAIIGDYEKKGLRGRVEDLEVRQTETERFTNEIKAKINGLAWKVVTIVVCSAASSVGITKLFEALFK